MLEQLFQSGFILSDVWIYLGPCPFKIHVTDQRRTAMTGAGNVDDVEIVFLYDPIQVDVDEILTGRGAPMSYHERFHMLQPQRYAQQRVIPEVDLPDGQIVGGPPIGVGFLKLHVGQGRFAAEAARRNMPCIDVLRRG